MPNHRPNLIGKKFDLWTVVRFSHSDKYGNKIWECKCDCGSDKRNFYTTSALNKGEAHSCGCDHKKHYIDTDEDRFFSKINKTDSCWLWTGSLNKMGYGQFQFKRKNFTSHRASWIIHFRKIPRDMFVCHKCDNRKCVNPDHLFLGTPKDNTQDMIKKGRKVINYKIKPEFWDLIVKEYKFGKSQREIARKYRVSQNGIQRILWRFLEKKDFHGENNGNSSLTQKQVDSIRQEYIPYFNSFRKIAEKYCVHEDTIARIIRGETWVA